MWALQCHVTGDNLHTCALICSAVGGLILSHYCRRCQHTPIAHMAAKGECDAIDSCRLHLSSGRPPEQTKKTKLQSWALAEGTGPLVAG